MGGVQKYSVSFDTDGGSLVLPQEVSWGECLSEPDVPYKEGYTFLGWYKGDSFYYFSQAVTEEFSLVARWSANSYKIVFDKNGAEDNSASMSRLYCTYNQEYKLPDNSFTSTGATFSGWATAKDGQPCYKDGTTVKNLSSVNGETITLYAVWTKNQYHKIIYENLKNAQNSAANPRKFLETQTISIQAPSDITGYSFDGWYLQSDYSGNPVSGWVSATYSDDVTLYAKWAPVSYTITLNDRENTTDFTLAYGEPVPNYTIPELAGATFGGFYSEPYAQGVQYINASGVGIRDFLEARDLDLYAAWEYKITYIIEDPDNIGYLNQNVLTYTGGSKIELLPLTLRNGYRFYGWKDSEGKDIEFIPKGSSGVKTITSKGFGISVYSIAYNLNDGEWVTDYIPTQDFTVETDEIVLPDQKDITRAGYGFDGWYTNPTFSEQKVFSIPKGTFENINLYAKWIEE